MQDTRHIYKDKDGRLIASIHLNGKRRLKRVKTKEQAHQWFLLVETESTAASSMKASQINDAANALALLKQHNLTMTLTELATMFVKDRTSNEVSITLKEAIREYEERSKARVAEKTLKGYSAMLRHFHEDVGDIDLASFKKADAMRYLDRFLDKPPTWMAYHRALSKFFAEAVKMDWCQANPFSNLDAPKCKPPERKFLSVEDTRKALKSVLNRKPQLIHFLTLGLFAGIRPVESLRLTSKHINMDTGYIHLTGDIVKSHSYKERVVPINDTLRAWLEAYPFGDKPVPGDNLDYVSREIKKCAIADGWEKSPDVFRHTFGSYESARTGCSSATAMAMGHSERIALLHYRGRVTREEALKFFDILPDRC